MKMPYPLYFSFLPNRFPKFPGSCVGVVNSHNATPGTGPGPGTIFGQSKLSLVLISKLLLIIGFFIKTAPCVEYDGGKSLT